MQVREKWWITTNEKWLVNAPENGEDGGRVFIAIGGNCTKDAACVEQ